MQASVVSIIARIKVPVWILSVEVIESQHPDKLSESPIRVRSIEREIKKGQLIRIRIRIRVIENFFNTES